MAVSSRWVIRTSVGISGFGSSNCVFITTPKAKLLPAGVPPVSFNRRMTGMLTLSRDRAPSLGRNQAYSPDEDLREKATGIVPP